MGAAQILSCHQSPLSLKQPWRRTSPPPPSRLSWRREKMTNNGIVKWCNWKTNKNYNRWHSYQPQRIRTNIVVSQVKISRTRPRLVARTSMIRVRGRSSLGSAFLTSWRSFSFNRTKWAVNLSPLSTWLPYSLQLKMALLMGWRQSRHRNGPRYEHTRLRLTRYLNLCRLPSETFSNGCKKKLQNGSAAAAVYNTNSNIIRTTRPQAGATHAKVAPIRQTMRLITQDAPRN